MRTIPCTELPLPQVDRSRHGKPLSTIIPNLGNDAKVTTPRHHVQHVVTEYSVADLSLMTDRERPRAMIKLAHPDFRPWLEESLRG